MRNDNNDTWTDMCSKRPVIKAPSIWDLFGRRRRRDVDFDDLFDDDEDWKPDATTDVKELAVSFRSE